MGGVERVRGSLLRVSEAAHLFEPIACADGDPVCVDVEMMRQLCLEDDGAQCLALSTAYHLGEGVRSDWRKSGDAAAAGCFLGHAGACVAMANAMDLGGFGDDVDRDLSWTIYERECFHHDEEPWACFGVARWIALFGGDREVALRALERGVEVAPTFEFLRQSLECMRAHPELSAFKCAAKAP